MNQPGLKGLKILLFDIETSPNLSWTWGIWEQNVIEVLRDWTILSVAYKWYGKKDVHVIAQCDYKGYKRGIFNLDDRKVMEELHKIFGEADVVIGHNSDAFDIRKVNARMLIHGLPPVSPFKSMDTLKMARRHFKFDSNKLDDLGRTLGVGRKVVHTGKDLWLRCMEGDRKAWGLMKKYNKQDVVLLERVYERLRGWSTGHVNMAYISREMGCCPRCGSRSIVKWGVRRNLTREYQRFQCTECKGYCYDGGEKLATRPLRV